MGTENLPKEEEEAEEEEEEVRAAGHPGHRISERPIPPPPKNREDEAAMTAWLNRCWILRNTFGSGN